MRFEQPSPTIDYRRNMILQALLKIDTLYELTQAASPKLLANIREALTDPDKICEMVTTVALLRRTTCFSSVCLGLPVSRNKPRTARTATASSAWWW